MKNQNTTSRSRLTIDLHVLVVGVMVSLLALGFSSLITFVPGSRIWLAALQFGMLPLILFLSPMIVTLAYDRRRFRSQALTYLVVNGILMLLLGLACALIVYSILPGRLHVISP